MGPRRASLLVLLALSLLLPPRGAAQSGDRIVLPGVDGGQLTEADFRRGATVLVVWASWSPRCRDVAARLQTLERVWSSRARVASVVFQEEPEQVRRFLAGADLRSAVYLDTTGAFSKTHAVTALPSLLVFKDGQAVFRGRLPTAPDPVIARALGLERP